MKEEWKKGYRRFIGLERCHLKWNNVGIHLCVVEVDAENGIYPIAFTVTETESKKHGNGLLRYYSRILG